MLAAPTGVGESLYPLAPKGILWDPSTDVICRQPKPFMSHTILEITSMPQQPVDNKTNSNRRDFIKKSSLIVAGGANFPQPVWERVGGWVKEKYSQMFPFPRVSGKVG